ncbi:MAG: carboxymuconolactone decarboxylase family protein [Dehalococcoidia bacterium]|nr:carboxymuconolactone decarboxylase family protein [Dehalococcoidia bacterium]
MARLPYITRRDDLPPENRDAWDRIQAGRGQVYRNFQLMLNSPELAARVCAVGDVLLHSPTLDKPLRELIMLAVARELNSQYEWSVHEAPALASGVRDHVIQGIKHRAYKGFLPKEKVFVDLAREVLGSRLSDGTWLAVEHLLGRQGAVDAVLFIGQVALISRFHDAVQLDPDPGMQPLLPIP